MFDTPTSTRGKAAAIKAMGHGAVIRYGSPNTAAFPTKQITVAESQELLNAGISISIVFEKYGDLAEMTSADGAADAKAMVALYKLLGIDGGKGIGMAFATDFDPDSESSMEAVGNYFRSAQPVVKDAGFLVTGYLCGAGLERFGPEGEGLIHYRWLPGAYAWSGSETALAQRQYDILQLPQKASCAGLDVDLDTHLPDLADCGFLVAA